MVDSTGYEDFDIDRSTAQGWTEFQARLSDVISVIDDSADLVIRTESDRADDCARARSGRVHGGPFVSFTAPRPEVILAEAANNPVLSGAHQLTEDDLTRMTRAGWQVPSPDQASAQNFWVELAQENCDELADLAVVALRDVYGVPHPVFLAPDPLAEILTPKVDDRAADDDDQIADMTGSAAVLPRSQEHLDTLVDAELTRVFGHQPIRDAEGDVAIRVGSTMVFLRTAPDVTEIVIFAAVVRDIEGGRSHAAEVLNDLNCDARRVKFQLIRDRVFVTLSVPAKPFVGAHLRQAVQIMSEVADGIDEDLAARLHGRTVFDDSRPDS